mmetsp:Transcript_134218/g.388522  ORF Transcript_134218/g.388522 Transcript_134218/m.388522 type:complete len:222 (+) Transcript_134218:2311-2976(+)
MRCRVALLRSLHSCDPASVRCAFEGGMPALSSAAGDNTQPNSVCVCSMWPGRCLAITSFFLFLHTNFGSKAGFQISSKHGETMSAAGYFLDARSTRKSFENWGDFVSFKCLPCSGFATPRSNLDGTPSSSAAADNSSFMSLAGTGVSRSVESTLTFSSVLAPTSSVSEVVSAASCNGSMPDHVEGTTPPSSHRRQPFARNWIASSRPVPGFCAKRFASVSR